jgi:hypothetical protein
METFIVEKGGRRAGRARISLPFLLTGNCCRGRRANRISYEVTGEKISQVILGSCDYLKDGK